MVKDEIRAQIDYVKRQSGEAAAFKVQRFILEKIRGLKSNPQRFKREAVHPFGNAAIRSVPIWSCKIVDHVNRDRVRLLRFFHTSQDPGKMWEE